jgi:beta-galactosidase
MKAIYFLACLLPALNLTGYGQRLTYNMDRNWKFYLGDTTHANEPHFNDRTWRTVDLPHDWSIEGTFNKDAPASGRGAYLPTGIGWYRKTLTLPAATKGKLISIRFDGIYMNSMVWINGHLLGRRPNGYITVIYKLTPWLHSGTNVIAVRVDNSLQPNSRWYSGSGIDRHVWLEATAAVHVAGWGTYVTTPVADSSQATVVVRTMIDNEGQTTATAELTTTIRDEAGRDVAAATLQAPVGGQNSTGELQELYVRTPALWSPAHPSLYTVYSVIRIGGKTVDEYQTTMGIRKIGYSAQNGLLLNGERVKMNGVCLHNDGGCVGAAVPVAIWKDRLRLLKAMGCNAIRTSHNPPDPVLLDLCDRMGFLVMDETFDMWETGKVKYGYNLYFDEWWQRDLVDQVHRDRNHPSVALWSAGNEVPEQTTDRGVELLKEQVAAFHREDSTRPVTTANDDIAADNGSAKLAFLQAEDIVGYNYADRWHERRELFYDEDRYIHPDWKVIGTESETVREFPQYSLGNDPVKVRANYTSGMIRAEQLWKFIAVRPFVIGDFMWTGVDYLGEARWPAKGAYSGVIDRSDVCKDGYYFYQSQWTSEPVLHLLPHWNWPGREGQVIPVLAYTNCDTVELLLNGKSYGVKSLEFPRQGNSQAWNKYDRPFVRTNTADLHLSWDVTYAPGVLKAIGYRNGHEVAEDSVVTSGAPAAIRLIMDTGGLYADGQDVALLHVEVLDAQGRFVPTAGNALSFTVEGVGRLIGTDNGDPADDHFFGSNRCTAFNGRAYAVIQTGLQSGRITIRVSGDGLAGAKVDCVSRPYRTSITNPL